jgi:hypothetical protein
MSGNSSNSTPSKKKKKKSRNTSQRLENGISNNTLEQVQSALRSVPDGKQLRALLDAVFQVGTSACFAAELPTFSFFCASHLSSTHHR